MKKIVVLLMATVLAVAISAAPQSKLALLSTTAKNELVAKTPRQAKALQRVLLDVNERMARPNKTMPVKNVAGDTKYTLKNVQKSTSDVISLNADGFLIGPEYEAETGEWYVAFEAQGYTFRLCWYGEEDDCTGSFVFEDISWEYTWGWYQSDTEFYEIYPSDITMTVSEKQIGECLKQIVLVGFDNYFAFVGASWLSPIIAVALAFGVLAGVLTWVSGPSKGIFAVGKAGYLPPFMQKSNKLGVQKNILLIQGCVVTILSLLFVVMPSVQSFYQILSQLTVLLYLIMYLMMFAAAIFLRYNMKETPRPFRLGKKGNGVMWIVAGVGFLGSLLAFVLSFIPPAQISVGSNAVWYAVLIIGCIVVVGAPFVIYAMRKPHWVDKESQFEPFHFEK